MLLSTLIPSKLPQSSSPSFEHSMVFLAQRSKSLPPSSQYDTVRSDAAITEYKIEAQNWGVLATGRLLRQCGVIELGHAKKKKKVLDWKKKNKARNFR